MAALVAAAVSGCSVLETPEKEPVSLGPIGCPNGKVEELFDADPSAIAAGELHPRRVGLGPAEDKVACVVRIDSRIYGATVVVVMRTGVARQDARQALAKAGLQEDAAGIMTRVGAARGQVEMLSLAVDRGHGSSTAPLVATGSLNIPHVKKRCDDDNDQPARASGPRPWERALVTVPKPGRKVVSCRPLTTKEYNKEAEKLLEPSGAHCQDVTSIDYNWDNDMLCTRADGSQFFTSYDGASAFLGH
ncbi:MAG TPA: hypothetical protein VNS81_00685 [Nocardioides sp.]|nr:hypothetical protein [Nocardioides sp.]